MLSIRLNDQTEQRLARLAEQTGRTKTYYVKQLVEEHIADLEDCYLAEARLEKRRTPLSSQQMRKELGLDH